MAIVYVWLPKQGLLFPKNLGHAALLIEDTQYESLRSREQYVSFWPQDNGSMIERASVAIFSGEAVAVPSYEDEINPYPSLGGRKWMGCEADRKVRIPDRATTEKYNNSGGLREDKMDSYWGQKIWRRGHSYQLYNSNCSTIVAALLLIGVGWHGLFERLGDLNFNREEQQCIKEEYGSYPVTPVGVLRFAEKLKREAEVIREPKPTYIHPSPQIGADGKPQCAYCGTRLIGQCPSMFNWKILICPECAKDERYAPGYAVAKATLQAEERRGNSDFEGVGLSNADRAFLAARRAQRGKS